MDLSAEDKDRIRERLERMIAEYRAKPTSELEDEFGLAVAVMPEPERDYVPTLLLEIVAAERSPR